MKKPHSFCNYCGWPFNDPLKESVEEKPWPRTCVACNNITYRNPLPVVVVVIPVVDKNNSLWDYKPITKNPISGVVAVRRGIEPDKGKLALVSGYIDDQEHWRDAAIRELKEETTMTFRRDQLELMDVDSSKNMKHLLVFCKTPPIMRNRVPNIKTNEEVQELVVIDDPNRLVWEAHQRMAGKVW